MSDLKKLQEVKTLREFSVLIGCDEPAFFGLLNYLLYKIPYNSKYVEFFIPKKNGGKRKICAPIRPLKIIQKRLAVLLYNCFIEIESQGSIKGVLAHGFRKDYSIITNAGKHKNRRYVFNVDLKDFFQTINFGRVRGYFIKNNYFKLSPDIATIIAQIACHNNGLPQGSPCSPIISLLIGHLLDVRMVSLAKKNNCTYSRYVDDLTFSTNKKDFPESMAYKSFDADDVWVCGKTLKNEIERAGFEINENKISFQYQSGRQIATGLVVNKKVNIRKEYYRQARSMCRSLFSVNYFYVWIAIDFDKIYIIDKALLRQQGQLLFWKKFVYAISKEKVKIRGQMSQLEGMLNFIFYVKSQCTESYDEKGCDPKGIKKLYINYLFYKYFFALEKPLIVCEGKTDVIYLRCALRRLSDRYGSLVNRKNNIFTYQINFLHSSKNIKELLGLLTGTGDMAKFVHNYNRYVSVFKGEGKKYPVIILLDDDKGARQFKKNNFIAYPFKSCGDNLYIAPIPSKNGEKGTEIEDFFDINVLETKVDGKTFNRNNKEGDHLSHYGKTIFAEKVIKENEKTIDFSGFEVILSQFVAVINDYANKIK